MLKNDFFKNMGETVQRPPVGWVKPEDVQKFIACVINMIFFSLSNAKLA
jgi:hypothetical protein